MRLDDYEWSRNPRGMHNESVFRIRPERYQQIRAGWVKLVTSDAHAGLKASKKPPNSPV